MRLSFCAAHALGVEARARLVAHLPPEEIADVQAQVALPLVEAFEPGFLARQFLLLAAEGVRVAQLGEEGHGILDAVNPEVQVVHLAELDPDLGVLGWGVGLLRGDAEKGLGGFGLLRERGREGRDDAGEQRRGDQRRSFET